MPLKFVLDFVVVVDLDFGDESIQSQAYRGVGHVVGGRQILQRAGKEDEPFGEREVLVLEKIDPALRIRCTNPRAPGRS